ncbi:MAG: hypothetical protein EXS09_01800 [Gemmataceae bacterium]|nr:hypothetical protein [Gemmataceae bacterium]
MKTVSLRELLTVAVDGELTPAERRAVDRALRESESARTLFAKLQADKARIKSLPRVAAPCDLAGNVLTIIQDRAMNPTPLPPVGRAVRKFNWSMLPIWFNVATAVAILVVVSLGSYSYFAASQNYFVNREQAQVAKVPDLKLPNYDDPTKVLEPKIVEVVRPIPETLVQKPREIGIEFGPSPRDVTDLLAGPIGEPTPEIEAVQLDKIRVSSLFALSDLSTDEVARKKLVAEMKKDELIRLDLFCGTTQKALDRVLLGLKARGINVVTDSFAADRLKKSASTEIVIFTETLTPEEVAQFLANLGAEDSKSSTPEFTMLVAAPFLPADLDKLGKLLGVPNVLPKPAVGKKAIDIRKPLPEGTANQVAASLAKMRTGSPTVPKSEKMAIVVAYAPMNAYPANSKEIKQFLDRRGERKPDAKPLMLVLRTIK